MKHLSFYAFIAFTLCLAAACKKSQNNSPGIATANIKSTGSFFAGEAVNFTIDPALEGRIYWDFGDGTIDSGINTKHAYPQIGTYSVKVDVYGTSKQTLTQNVTINSNPRRIYSICGPKLWRVSKEFDYPSGPPQVVTSPDSSFALTFVDSAHIMAGADTLSYVSTASNDTMDVFSVNRVKFTYTDRMTYYANSRSIIYERSSHSNTALILTTFKTGL